MKDIRIILVVGFQGIACLACLSLACTVYPLLPVEETVGHWLWFDKAALVAAGCMLVAAMLREERYELAVPLSWSLILLGGIEAIWGLRQLYGFATSNHSLYALTGSFFNPGPYSGYLAMVLPICLYQWLICSRKEEKLRQTQYGVGETPYFNRYSESSLG